jgi:hypothetical protein
VILAQQNIRHRANSAGESEPQRVSSASGPLWSLKSTAEATVVGQCASTGAPGDAALFVARVPPPWMTECKRTSAHDDEPNDERRRANRPRSISMIRILDDLIKTVKITVKVDLTA